MKLRKFARFSVINEMCFIYRDSGIYLLWGVFMAIKSVPIHIRELREDSDMTQQQVADYLGMNREVYRRYENGVYELPVWAIIKLSELYGVSADYILDLNTERRLPQKRA